MARQKRRRPASARPRATSAREEADARRSALPEWRWLTFPVFFAFFGGALIMALLNGTPNNEVAAVAQFVALAAVCYGAARIVVRKFFAERRARLRTAAHDDEDFEDVVVYPEDTAANR